MHKSTPFLTPRRRLVVVVSVASIVSGLFFAPAFLHLNATGYGDWQVFHHMWEAGRASWLRDGEWPLWNPYHCGGVFLFGDPQAQVYGPLFFLLLGFPTTIGIKLFVLIHATAGMSGMVVFAKREVHLSVAASWLSGVLWCFSGFFAWHMSGGHAAFVPFYFAPWLLVAWRRCIDEPRYSTLVAGLLALTLFEGGVYPFPFLVLLLAFDGLTRIRNRRVLVQTLRATGLVSALTVTLSGFRLLPILDTIQSFPRPTLGNDSLSASEAVEMFTARTHAYRWGHEYVWAEYGSYLGWCALVLAGLGVLFVVTTKHRQSGKRSLWLVLGLLVFGGLMLGDQGAFSPWSLIHNLPIYRSLRVPSRFAVLTTLFLSLLAGVGLDHVRAAIRSKRDGTSTKWRRSVARLLPWCLLLASGLDLLVVSMPTLDRWNGPVVPNMQMASHYVQVPQSSYARVATFPARNVGSRSCYTGMEGYDAAVGIWEGQQPQVRLESIARDAGIRPSSGDALVHEGRTQNTMYAEVNLVDASQLIFNQTYVAGWRSNVGEVSRSPDGLIQVALPSGHHDVVIRYRPDSLLPASLLSGLGAILSLVVWFGFRKKRHAIGGAKVK